MSITMIVISSSSSSTSVETIAGEAGIYPGHFLGLTTAGKFIRGTVSSTIPQPRIATENIASGKEVGDAYSLGDVVFARILRQGDVCYIMVQGGESLSIGSMLEANGAVNPGEFHVAASEFTGTFCSLEEKTTVGSELCKAEATL